MAKSAIASRSGNLMSLPFCFSAGNDVRAAEPRDF
jgi:hypothetical protein